MVFLFLICLLTVLYVYIGYPVLLASGILGARKKPSRAPLEPVVSILVPAHNEEGVIRAKIEGLLALDYPKDKLEILVGSDGSTDRTEEFVRQYAGAGVQLLSFTQQVGKSAIQNALVEKSTGSVLVFSDADCQPSTDAVRRLVENFADPAVGLVTAGPVYANAGDSQIGENEGLYWRYENWIRGQESERGLLATASGWFFGMRRSLWKPLDANVGDDFVLPLQTALEGFRNVVDERIRVLSDFAAERPSSMFAMKKRIISKDLRGLFANRRALNPFSAGCVAIGLWSHKLLRWAVPYFMAGLLLSSAFLIADWLFLAFLCLQLAFYAAAAGAYWVGGARARLPWSIPLSFCIVNGAALAGTLHFATRRTVGRWKPTRQ